MKYFISFGAGQKQEELLKASKGSGFKNIAVVRKKDTFKRKLIDKIIFGSSYDHRNILKKLNKTSKIDDILFRSSGPAILSYYQVSKKYFINRLDKNLSRIIYSKFFLYNYLKKKNFDLPKSYLVKNKIIKNLRDKNFIIKPDAPIVGKKNIFFIHQDSKLKKIKKFLNLSNSCSDNKKSCFSQYIKGEDITAFFFKSKSSRIIESVNYIQEFNKFNISGKLVNIGSCSPPIIKNFNVIKKKINFYGQKLGKLFPAYYGFYSLSFKNNNKGLLLYEVNVGLSGDSFVEKIYPKFHKKNAFIVEIENINGKIRKKIFKEKKNIFVGILKRNNILYEKKIYNQTK